MESSPSVAESAGIWELDKVTQILSNTTDLIQLKASDQDKIDKSNKPFQAMVHKDLLCFFSKCYRAALQGGFLEAGNKSVVLELKTADCQYFVGCVYTGRLPDVPRADLFPLYVFADKTDMLAVRRAIMTRVAGCGDDIPPEFCEAAVTLNSLPSTSPLYQWLLHTYTRHSLSGCLEAKDALPYAFLLDWINEGRNGTRTNSSKYCRKCQHPCNYHEHESVEE